jgi:hypothetical protein
MPLDSVICRKNLDERRGNPWICECPMCRGKRKDNLLNPGEGKDKGQGEISSCGPPCEDCQDQEGGDLK